MASRGCPTSSSRARASSSPGDTPPPACFGPIAPTWKERWSKLGTYDRAWFKQRWPYFPADFDWTHFQSAPAQQQLPYLTGDEQFEIVGMFPDRPSLRGELPGVRARAFVQKTKEAGGGFVEVPTVLDTAVFDLDAMRVHLVWRGHIEVSDDDAPEVQQVFVTREDLHGAPRTIEEARARYVARRRRQAARVESPDAPAPAADEPPAPTPSPRGRSSWRATKSSGRRRRRARGRARVRRRRRPAAAASARPREDRRRDARARRVRRGRHRGARRLQARDSPAARSGRVDARQGDPHARRRRPARRRGPRRRRSVGPRLQRPVDGRREAHAGEGLRRALRRRWPRGRAVVRGRGRPHRRGARRGATSKARISTRRTSTTPAS